MTAVVGEETAAQGDGRAASVHVAWLGVCAGWASVLGAQMLFSIKVETRQVDGRFEMRRDDYEL